VNDADDWLHLVLAVAMLAAAVAFWREPVDIRTDRIGTDRGIRADEYR
jgi:hypothetical protein